MDYAWSFQRSILGCFYNYGYLLARYPLYFLVIPLVICGVLGIGLQYVESVNDVEFLYAPMESRSLADRQTVRKTFTDNSDTSFSPFSLNDLISESVVIFRSKKEKSILTQEVIDELTSFFDTVMSLKAYTGSGMAIVYQNVCKKQGGACVIFGAFVFENDFLMEVQAGNVTYPSWSGTPGLDLTRIFSKVDVGPSNELLSAGSFKITFPNTGSQNAKFWESAFAEHIRNTAFTTVDIAYTTSTSMSEELSKGTKADIVFFSLTFTFMITFASIVSSGGDCVSSRIMLANAGVLAVGFGILGAFGLITLFGVQFVSIVATMPFLTLGIGVDDMFLLMSSWSETLPMTLLTIPERIGKVYKKAGIGITITSVTDFLAFAIGSTSRFRSVRNFCIYSGAGVIMCYICNACVFGACLTFHAHRVYASRHVFTCQKVPKSRAQLREDGASICKVFLCGGEIPTTTEGDQSVCERGPRSTLVRLLLWNPVRYLTLVVFAGYLAVALWGCTKLKQGLELKNLAPRTSYFHVYRSWFDEDYGTRLIISFVTTKTKDYTQPQSVQELEQLLQKAQEDPMIGPQRGICWLLSLAGTPLYNTTSEDAFYSGLQQFLSRQPYFKNDIRFAPNKAITASRCHVYSKMAREKKMQTAQALQFYFFRLEDLKGHFGLSIQKLLTLFSLCAHLIFNIDSNDQANLMINMRKVADASLADVFAYHPAFVMFEQYVVIMTDTLQTVGVTIAVMFIVTCIFLPHPLIVVLVTSQLFMIIVGIIGFMAFWDLTLSSITMIELIMSVGFSVDFCAHVCTAYMVSDEHSREDRAKDAIIHASGPIFNGGISSIIGVCVLIFTESYIFQSFFKIMLLVIGFGVLHAVFLIPVILSFIGPSTHVHLEQAPNPDQTKSVKQRGSVASPSLSINREVKTEADLPIIYEKPDNTNVNPSQTDSHIIVDKPAN